MAMRMDNPPRSHPKLDAAVRVLADHAKQNGFSITTYREDIRKVNVNLGGQAWNDPTHNILVLKVRPDTEASQSGGVDKFRKVFERELLPYLREYGNVRPAPTKRDEIDAIIAEMVRRGRPETTDRGSILIYRKLLRDIEKDTFPGVTSEMFEGVWRTYRTTTDTKDIEDAWRTLQTEYNRKRIFDTWHGALDRAVTEGKAEFLDKGGIGGLAASLVHIGFDRKPEDSLIFLGSRPALDRFFKEANFSDERLVYRTR